MAQYSPGTYYLIIREIKAKAGIPSNAEIISASMSGWGGLGVNPNIELNSSDDLWVFYTPNTSITADAYVTVRFVYQ